MKSIFKEKVLPLICLILVTGAGMGALQLLKGISTMKLQPTMWVAGEQTEPTLGRLIAGLVFLFLSIMFLYISMQREKRFSEDAGISWVLAAIGGTLLWIFLGEITWHYGMPVLSKEGVRFFVNYPRIESIQGVWLFLLLFMVDILMIRRGAVSLTLYLATFLGNWYGHLCMIATYPVARLFGCNLDMQSWYRLSGLVNAVVLALVGLWLMRKDTKYLGTVFLYVAMGTLLYGTILGKV